MTRLQGLTPTGLRKTSLQSAELIFQFFHPLSIRHSSKGFITIFSNINAPGKSLSNKSVDVRAHANSKTHYYYQPTEYPFVIPLLIEWRITFLFLNQSPSYFFLKFCKILIPHQIHFRRNSRIAHHEERNNLAMWYFVVIPLKGKDVFHLFQSILSYIRNYHSFYAKIGKKVYQRL